MDAAPQMTVDIALTLGVAAGALLLFVWGRLRIEVVGLLVMAGVILLGLVPPAEAISGFANEAVVTVALVLGLSAGLLRTGAVDALGRAVARIAGDSESRLAATVVAIVMPMSALINNTAAVAVLLPMVTGLARRARTAASRLLMPLSFGSQLGGILTLIGTSTNLLVAGMVVDLGLEPMSLFQITPAAAVLAVVGGLYLLTVGRWITPHRESAEQPLISRQLRQYVSELVVDDGSDLIGRTVEDTDLEEEHDVTVLAIQRDEQRLESERRVELEAGDCLLVSGAPDDIARLAQSDRLTVKATASTLEEGHDDHEERELRLAEVMVSPRSRAIQEPLRRVRRALAGDVTVLALERHGAQLEEPIGDIQLNPGDVLLVRAPLQRLRAMHESGDYALLGVVELPEKRTERMWVAAAIMVGVVTAAAVGVTSILVSALVGMLLMVLTGCVRPQEVYRQMDWGVVILLGSLLSLGHALQSTGTATYVAAGLIDVIRPLGATGVLAAFFLLTSVLTSVITNNAAAVVLTPVAVAAARDLGVSPWPLVVAVMFAASTAFSTPVGYQTNIFIYGPGGYRFTDFLRVGGPLVLVMAVTAALILPLVFPFAP